MRFRAPAHYDTARMAAGRRSTSRYLTRPLFFFDAEVRAKGVNPTDIAAQLKIGHASVYRITNADPEHAIKMCATLRLVGHPREGWQQGQWQRGKLGEVSLLNARRAILGKVFRLPQHFLV